MKQQYNVVATYRNVPLSRALATALPGNEDPHHERFWAVRDCLSVILDDSDAQIIAFNVRAGAFIAIGVDEMAKEKIATMQDIAAVRPLSPTQIRPFQHV